MGKDDFDIRDFIKETFTDIWTEKLLGTVYERYRHNVTVYSGLGKMEYGRDRLVEKAVSFLAAFPDTEMSIEDCITSGERSTAGKVFCRWTLRAHHTGEGVYGPPSGRAVEITGITCCTVEDRRITEQWDEWDRLGLLRQLGIDENEFVRSRLERGGVGIYPQGAPSPGPAELCFPAPPDPVSRVWGEVERLSGQAAPPRPADRAAGAAAGKTALAAGPEAFIRALYQHIWNLRNVGKADAYYGKDAAVHCASGRKLSGRDELKAYILSMLAPFPDAAVFIDDLVLVGGQQGGRKAAGEASDGPTAGKSFQAAVRWSLAGTHRKHGRYGPPAGISCRITCLTMLTGKNGRVAEEWTEFGEFELLRELEQKRLRDAQHAEADVHAESFRGETAECVNRSDPAAPEEKETN